MTPAERIAAAVTRLDGKGCTPDPWLAADAALFALCPKGERIVIDRTGDTDRLAEPFNIELLTERLRLANARLLAYDGDPRVRPRLEAKAEGVRLALSYISDMTREDGPDE